MKTSLVKRPNIPATEQSFAQFSPFMLSLYNRIYFPQHKIESFILEWSTQFNNFHSDGASAKKYWLSYFNVYIVSLLIGFSSCTMVFLNQSKVSAINNIASLMLSAFFACFCIQIVSSVTVITFHLKNVIAGFVDLQHLCHLLFLETKSFKILLDHSNKLGVFRYGPKFWKHLIRSTSLSFPVLHFLFNIFVIPMCLFKGLDPFSASVPAFIPNILYGTWAAGIIRGILCYLCVNEASRFLFFYFSMMFYHTELQICCLRKLHEIPYRAHHTFIRWYNAYTVVENTFQGIISILLGIFMGPAFVVFIVCNVITLKLYGKILFLIYWVFPVMSLGCCLISCLLLSFSALIGESSQNIVEHHKHTFMRTSYVGMSAFEKKVLRRKLACLKPVTLGCGDFYILRRDSVADFFFYVVLRTMEVLVTGTSLGIFN